MADAGASSSAPASSGGAARHAAGEKVLLSLFGLQQEHVISDFSCAVVQGSALLLHGRLYITAGGGARAGQHAHTHHLCFYSNVFGRVTRRVLPFSNIISVTRMKRAYVIPSLEVVARVPDGSGAGGEQRLVFISFFANGRDMAHSLCQRILIAIRGVKPAVANAPVSLSSGGGGGSVLVAPSPPLSVTGSDREAPSRSDSLPGLSRAASQSSTLTLSSIGSTTPSMLLGGAEASPAVRKASASSGGRGTTASANETDDGMPPLQDAEGTDAEGVLSDGSAPPPAGGAKPAAPQPALQPPRAGSDAGSAASSVAGSAPSRGRLSSGTAGDVYEEDGSGYEDDELDGYPLGPLEGEGGEDGGDGGGGGGEEDAGAAEASLPPVPTAVWERVTGMIPLVDMLLPCTVARFNEVFLSDAASFPISEFHRTSQRCFNITVTPWNEVPGAAPLHGGVAPSSGSSEGGFVTPSSPAGRPVSTALSSPGGGNGSGGAPQLFMRTIRMRMPLPVVPFAPRDTAVEKTQQFGEYSYRGKRVLVVDSTSRSFDVPFGDYFSTQETWFVTGVDAGEAGEASPFKVPIDAPRVAASPAAVSAMAAAMRKAGHVPPTATDAEAATGMCRLVISMRMAFEKSTIFKSKISSTTEKEVRKMYDVWIADTPKFLLANPPPPPVVMPRAPRAGGSVRLPSRRRSSGTRSGRGRSSSADTGDSDGSRASNLTVAAAAALWRDDSGSSEAAVGFTPPSTASTVPVAAYVPATPQPGASGGDGGSVTPNSVAASAANSPPPTPSKAASLSRSSSMTAVVAAPEAASSLPRPAVASRLSRADLEAAYASLFAAYQAAVVQAQASAKSSSSDGSGARRPSLEVGSKSTTTSDTTPVLGAPSASSAPLPTPVATVQPPPPPPAAAPPSPAPAPTPAPAMPASPSPLLSPPQKEAAASAQGTLRTPSPLAVMGAASLLAALVLAALLVALALVLVAAGAQQQQPYSGGSAVTSPPPPPAGLWAQLSSLLSQGLASVTRTPSPSSP